MDFDRRTAAMLRRTGREWTVQETGETFYAIFDQQNRLGLEDGSPVVLTGSVITCLTSIANRFFRLKATIADQNDRVWYCREMLMMDDGALSRISIVSIPEDCE